MTTAHKIDGDFWVEFDTHDGLYEHPYHSDVEWVLSWDEYPIGFFIEYVSRNETNRNFGGMACPANWCMV